MSKNRCYTNAIKIKPEKLVLHSLGVAQPNADVLIKSWNNKNASVCAHAFIETDRVVQTLPWDYKGWHVGKGSKGSWNGKSIGVEICEPKGHTYKGGTMINYNIEKNSNYFSQVYQNAVELFAYLCKKFDLNPMLDIFCHSEVHRVGYASNHADVMHWFPKHGASMDAFRKDVASLLALINYVPSKTITPESPKKDIIWAQKRYNVVLPQIYPEIKGIIPMDVTGIFGPELRIATTMYWYALKWGNHMRHDGTGIGIASIEALAVGRIE